MKNGRENTDVVLTAELILVLSEERGTFCRLSTLNAIKLSSSTSLCRALRASCLALGAVILPGPLPAPSSRESATQGEEMANLE